MSVANSQVYNIQTENEVAIILSRFNSNFIFDVIRDNLAQKFNYSFISAPNVVAAFEQNFKYFQIRYPSDYDNIEVVRISTYKEIINILCNEYNLQFNDNDGLDYYSLALYLYDFLACNFNNYMVSFFANYIYKEKNSLYEFLNMEALKKNKDSSTIYGKKIYKDPKLAILNANLNSVIASICNFDITFENILSIVYSNKNIVNYLTAHVSPINDFFKSTYCYSFSLDMQPVILTNIRLEIQKMAVLTDN